MIFDMAPPGIPELEKLREYSDNFGGANFNGLLIETEPQGLTYPETIDAIYNMELEMRKWGVDLYSIADELKKVNEILKRDEIIERLGDLVDVDTIVFDTIAEEGLVDEDFSKTLILVYIPIGMSIEESEKLVKKVNEIEHLMEGDEHCRLYFKTEKIQFGTSTLMPGKTGAVDSGHKEGEEIFFVSKGKVLLFLPNEKRYYELSEGDAILIPPGEPHKLLNPNPKIAVVCWSLAPPDRS